MPPTDRYVCRFAAEPPQDKLPYGRWGDKLRVEFLAACLRVDDEGEDLGESGEIVWYPDRTYNGRTYIPASTRTTTGYELYGYVSFQPATDNGDPTDLQATADFTAETAEENPDWQLDLCEDVVDAWRGDSGNVAAMTLVWGRPMVGGGVIATAELADLAVDQCELLDGRFTLLGPDNYRGDILDIKLFDSGGKELASESLYEDDGEDDAEDLA